MLLRRLMGCIKTLIFITFLLLGYGEAFATNDSGVGCNLGNRIYTRKIGTTNFWGTKFDVYDSNGAAYPINWNRQIVSCDNVEDYNVKSQAKSCWVNSTVPKENTNGGSGNGDIVSYTKCIGKPNANLPLDDYIWVLLVAVAAFGSTYIIRSKFNTSA